MYTCLFLAITQILTATWSTQCEYYDSESFGDINIINQSLAITLDFRVFCGGVCLEDLAICTNSYQKSCNILNIEDDRNASYLSLFVNSTNNKYAARIYDNYVEITDVIITYKQRIHLHIMPYGVIVDFETLKTDGNHHWYYQFSEALNGSNNMTSSINFATTLNESQFKSIEVCIDTPAYIEDINCGDTKLTTHYDNYILYMSVYSFHASGNESFLFSLCQSEAWDLSYVYVEIYQMDNESNIHSLNTTNGCAVFIESLIYGDYLLAMTFGERHPLDMICTDPVIEEIECGDAVEGALISTLDVAYYYLNILEDRAISFDSCDSDFDTNITLYPLNSNHLNFDYFYPQDKNEKCDLGIPSLMIDALPFGQYLFEIKANSDTIHGHNTSFDGIYSLKVKCSYPKYYECGGTISGEMLEEYQFGIIEYIMSLSTAKDILLDGTAITGGPGTHTYSAYSLAVYRSGSDWEEKHALFNTHIGEGDTPLDPQTSPFLVPSDQIISLEAGDYILELENGYSATADLEYLVKIICYTDIIDDHNDTVIPYIAIRTSTDNINTWLDADTECRQKFGTSLANIKDYADLYTANKVVLSQFNDTDEANLYISSFENESDPINNGLSGTIITFHFALKTIDIEDVDPWSSDITTQGVLCNCMFSLCIV